MQPTSLDKDLPLMQDKKELFMEKYKEYFMNNYLNTKLITILSLNDNF